MKKYLKIFAVIAALVSVLSACQKIEETQDTPEDQEIHFTVTADSVEPVADVATKTAFVDEANPYVAWLSTDAISLWEIVDDHYNSFDSSSAVLGTGGKTASFDVTLTGEVNGNQYVYTAVYPQGAVSKSSSNFYYFEIPSTQTLVNGNFAADADVLISKPKNPTSRISGSQSFQFKRPGTVVKLTLKGITKDETISKITLTAPSANDIAGRCKVDLKTGAVTDEAYYGGTNVIILNCNNIVATGEDAVYFRCLSGEWASGAPVGISVETNAATYSKSVNLPKKYQFVDGGLTKFGFQGMTRESNDENTKYSLVTSGSELFDGASYIFVGIKNTNYYAMGKQNSNNRAAVSVNAPVDDVISLPSNTEAYTFSLESVTGGWAIKDITSQSDSYGKYLYAAATGSNNMKSQDNVDDNATWTIDISGDGTATAVAEKSSNRNNLRFNTSSTLFSCYSTGQEVFYIYVDPTTCKETLASPVMEELQGDNFAKTITVSWTDVANATGYVVSCTGQPDQNISAGVQTCVFTNLPAGDYTVTVNAVDSGDTYRPSSSSKIITLYDPSITLSTLSVDNLAVAGDDYDDITYTLAHATDDDLTWTCDGTVVTEVLAAGGEIVYTVSSNNGNAREGWIKVTLNGNTQIIIVSQLSGQPKIVVNSAEINVASEAGSTLFSYSVVNSVEGKSVSASTTADWITSYSCTDAGLSVEYSANESHATREATFTLSYDGAEDVTVTLKQAKSTVYASLDELISAGAPSSLGEIVTVTLSDVKITDFYTSGGYRNGVYVKANDQDVELYLINVPVHWVVGGSISGSIKGLWYLYKDTTWELKPDGDDTWSWDSFTYVGPGLESVSISGQTTSFQQNGTFAFGGTVTAHYVNGQSANVTSLATFSGYDLSQTGEQTVTVSYTENGITKTDSYSIIVSSGGAGGEVVTKTLIIDGAPLTSTATSEPSNVEYGDYTIRMSSGAKFQSASNTSENKFADKAILIGKSGAYIYNVTPINGVITKFEIYTNAGASAKVSVGVVFSDSSISSYSTGSNTYTATLSTLDTVYDCSSYIPSDCKYFWYQVTNAYNSQVQFRITYETNE